MASYKGYKLGSYSFENNPDFLSTINDTQNFGDGINTEDNTIDTDGVDKNTINTLKTKLLGEFVKEPSTLQKIGSLFQGVGATASVFDKGLRARGTNTEPLNNYIQQQGNEDAMRQLRSTQLLKALSGGQSGLTSTQKDAAWFADPNVPQAQKDAAMKLRTAGPTIMANTRENIAEMGVALKGPIEAMKKDTVLNKLESSKIKLANGLSIVDEFVKQGKPVTVQQLNDLQQGVALASTGGGQMTGSEREDRYIKSLEQKIKSVMTYIKNNPQGISPNDPILQQVISEAKQIQSTIAGLADKRANTMMAGYGSILEEHPKWKKDIQDVRNTLGVQFQTEPTQNTQQIKTVGKRPPLESFNK